MNASEPKRVRIIIVDDQEIMRVGLRLTLEQFADFDIIGEADDGPVAVATGIQLRPHVVLMDIGLKTMDGIEAVRLIKEKAPEVRVIMFTSHESEDEIFASLSAGAEGYCLKAIPTKQLEMAIRSVATGAAWLDPALAGKVLRAGQKQQATNPSSKQENFGLSPRELEVLGCVVDGLSNQEIADKLVVSTETVKTHIRHVMEKLAVSDRTQAAVKALRQGLL